MLSGYEPQWNDSEVDVLDILDSNIWMPDHLKVREKLVIATVITVVLLNLM